MLSSVVNFMRRHKKKIVVASAVVGGAYWLWKYTKNSLTQFQEREMTEYINHTRKWQHFENNQRTCHMTVLSLLPSLNDRLVVLLNTEELTRLLKSNPPNKIEIWNQLKLHSFTRTVSAVYAVTVLQLYVRVQLNIVGGYMFLDSSPKLSHITTFADTPHSFTNSTVQKKYLEAVQYILSEGLGKLVDFVAKETEKNLKEVQLQQKVNLLFIESLINHVRQAVEHPVVCSGQGSSVLRVTQLMLPPTPDSSSKSSPQMGMSDDEKVAHILMETSDVVESHDFQTVLTGCLDTAFNYIIDEIAERFKPSVGENGVMQHPNDVTVPVAKVIPLVNNIIFKMCRDTPNPVVQELALKPMVKDFSANVYEAFSEAK